MIIAISEMQLKQVEDAETVRNNPRLDVVPKPSPFHPSHAGIEMFLDSGVLYKSCADEPTPHEILVLQLYLSSIIEKVIEK